MYVSEPGRYVSPLHHYATTPLRHYTMQATTPLRHYTMQATTPLHHASHYTMQDTSNQDTSNQDTSNHDTE